MKLAPFFIFIAMASQTDCFASEPKKTVILPKIIQTPTSQLSPSATRKAIYSPDKSQSVRIKEKSDTKKQIQQLRQELRDSAQYIKDLEDENERIRKENQEMIEKLEEKRIQQQKRLNLIIQPTSFAIVNSKPPQRNNPHLQPLNHLHSSNSSKQLSIPTLQRQVGYEVATNKKS